MPAKMECPLCKGEGVVPHEKRKVGPENARVDDPMDFQTVEVCSKCGGGGKVLYVDSEKPASYSEIMGDCG